MIHVLSYVLDERGYMDDFAWRKLNLKTFQVVIFDEYEDEVVVTVTCNDTDAAMIKLRYPDVETVDQWPDEEIEERIESPCKLTEQDYETLEFPR